MTHSTLLFTMGLNQTLVLALLPRLAEVMGLNNGESWGMVVIVLNINLLSYWFCSGLWGRYIPLLGTALSRYLSSIGFIISTLGFVGFLYLSESPDPYILAAFRLATGCFTSAFLPIAQSHLAQENHANVGSLSKLSSHITLGRFLGPVLLLLPLPLDLLLVAPALLALIGLVPKTSGSEVPSLKQLGKQQTINSTSVFGKIPWAGLAVAALTTMLVTSTQLVVLPFITSFGYSATIASEHYAKVMLFITLIVVGAQRWVIPTLSRLNLSGAVFLFLLLAALNLGTLTLFFGMYYWIQLLIGLTLIALGISGLPAWYTHRLLTHKHKTISHAQVSGAIAQAHTLGHLMGTAISAALLSFIQDINALLFPVSLVLGFCALQTWASTKSKGLNEPLTLSSQKEHNENP